MSYDQYVNAIDVSIMRDCIAHLEYSEINEEELLEACDDYVDCGTHIEFWGEREGEPWRVHLDRSN